MRPEDHAAATPVRCADGTLTSTAGALLTERLLAAAADHAAGLGLMGAGTPGRTLHADNLVHDRNVRLDAEHGIGELGRRGLLAFRGFDIDSCHWSLTPYQFPLPATRTRTMPFLPPGTAPFTTMMFRSSSTRTTSRFLTVTRSQPM